MQGSFHVRLATLFLLVALGVGCTRPRPTPVPLRSVSYPGAGQPRTLVVLLPGRRDRPEDFGDHDFPRLAAQAGARVDMVALDAHPGYYWNRTIVDRLREDLLASAHERYDHVWLVGVSLGGTGSLLYASRFAEDVDGILLLAPYLGEDEVIDEIEAARRLELWQPPPVLSPTDFQRALWAWLRDGVRGRIPLYLGYGRSDRFARANGLLARELPPERVFMVPGGHGWRAWRAAWEAFLKTGALSTPTSPGGEGRPE